MPDQDDWPFEEPENTAVITTRRIMEEGRPILSVFRDAEEGEWQFLDGEDVGPEDAMVVGFGSILRHDPSVSTLADLPPGWVAWRDSADADWQRAPDEDAE